MKSVVLLRIFCEDERKRTELEKMGVGVGYYDPYENCFSKCICPKNVIPKLKKKYKFCLEDTSDSSCWYA